MDVTADQRSFTALREWLTGRVAGFLERPVEEISTANSLAENGLDSMYALMLCGDIEDHFGLVMEPEVAWNHRTIDGLAGYLATELEQAEVNESA